MSEKKKVKQRKIDEEELKPTKEEYAVAKFLRFNTPTRDGKLHGMEVKCFLGNAAVDKLMDSKWSSTKNKKDPLFHNRAACVSYLVRLLEKGLFHRAEKDKKKKEKEKEKMKKKKNTEKDETVQDTDEAKEKKSKKDKKSQKDKDGESNQEETEKKDKKDDKKKKEKILKLLMPETQYFADGNEVYVWIYDPVHAKNFLIGILIVAGAISLCMFPLWPESVRLGVYYLSLCAAGFVGFILSLAVIRLILFCCIWVLTMGKHHFWLLPNLTEDVGFFESFVPLYKHDYITEDSKDGKKKKKKEDKEIPETEESSKKEDKDDCEEFEVIKQEDVEELEGMDMENNENDENIDDDDDYDDDDDNDIEGTEDENEDKKTK